MNQKRVHVIVTGGVQGVAFRANCQRQAIRLGVNGWVRNRWDGSVEAVFEGPTAAVDTMVRWCHHGPSAATVSGVEVSDAPPGEPYRSFSIQS